MTLDGIGADGLVPISTLPWDYYDHDDKLNRLVGRDSGRTFCMGDAVTVALREANTDTGGLVFELETEGSGSTGKRSGKKRPGFRSSKSGHKKKPGRNRR
ncbi:MAG: hypothetical protein O3B08_04350 [Proteobacteria bacterium]|nr:hypothetical protein [Pseudomonadota bacterium]